MKNLSWVIERDFDEHIHLFHKKVETGYKIKAYACACGKKRCFVLGDTSELEYKCPCCDNANFYDANLAKDNFYGFLEKYNFQITPQFEIVFEKKELLARYYWQIPQEINFLRDQVIFKKQSIISLRLTEDGKEEFPKFLCLYTLKKTAALLPNIAVLPADIQADMRKELQKYIIKNNIFNISRVIGYERLSYEQIRFFIKNPLLSSLGLYEYESMLNHHTREWSKDDLPGADVINEIIVSLSRKKAIKKAIYRNYHQQMQRKEVFYINFILAFNYSIEDINILQRLILLDLEEKYLVPYKELYKLILFLKKHYSEKQIYHFFKKLQEKKDRVFLRDLMHLFEFSEDHNLLGKFRKVKCNPTQVHHEMVYLHNEQVRLFIENVDFLYRKNEKRAEIKIGEYEVKLPHTSIELLDWSEKLDNCLLSYQEGIQSNLTLIYGFLKKKKPDFAIEVHNGAIIQASSFSNTPLNKKQEFILQTWKKRNFQLLNQHRQNMTK